MKRAFQRQNCMFTVSLIVLAVMFICAVGLFTVLAVRGYRLQGERRALRRELEREYVQWQDQQISSYRVVYTNCNSYFCCQGAVMRVENGVYASITPDCSQGSYPYAGYGYHRITTMDETYLWLNDWLRYNEDRPIEIEYHPDLHYVTRITLTQFEGANEIVIEYQSLEPVE